MNGLRLAALGAALALGAATAIAQPPASAPQPPAAGQHRGGMHGAMRGGMRGPAGGRALFRGVTLNDTQKAQVQAIRRKYAEQRRSLMGQYRERAGATQGQRVRPDSATRAQMHAQARDLMQRELAETRGVLTADQQRAFDANVATMRARADGKPGKRGQPRQGRAPNTPKPTR